MCSPDAAKGVHRNAAEATSDSAHVSARLRGGGWGRPAAGAEWMAETVRRLLADMWQNYTSGEHSKHIYTNACFRLVCLHLVNEC